MANCPICWEPYNVTTLYPMAMSCGHSLCYPCLQQLAPIKRDLVACPLRCERPSFRPSVPKNYLTLQLITEVQVVQPARRAQTVPAAGPKLWDARDNGWALLAATTNRSVYSSVSSFISPTTSPQPTPQPTASAPAAATPEQAAVLAQSALRRRVPVRRSAGDDGLPPMRAPQSLPQA